MTTKTVREHIFLNTAVSCTCNEAYICRIGLTRESMYYYCYACRETYTDEDFDVLAVTHALTEQKVTPWN